MEMEYGEIASWFVCHIQADGGSREMMLEGEDS